MSGDISQAMGLRMRNQNDADGLVNAAFQRLRPEWERNLTEYERNALDLKRANQTQLDRIEAKLDEILAKLWGFA